MIRRMVIRYSTGSAAAIVAVAAGVAIAATGWYALIPVMFAGIFVYAVVVPFAVALRRSRSS